MILLCFYTRARRAYCIRVLSLYRLFGADEVLLCASLGRLGVPKTSPRSSREQLLYHLGDRLGQITVRNGAVSLQDEVSNKYCIFFAILVTILGYVGADEVLLCTSLGPFGVPETSLGAS